MGYNTETTIWPKGDVVAQPTKDLLDRFFNLLDSEDVGVGDTLADEIFGKTAKAHFGGHLFEGPDQIRKSRDQAWSIVSRRRHTLIQVYSSGTDGSDLLFIGHVEMDFRNGKGVAGEFTGRLVVEDATGTSPKLLLYQIWADSAPVTKALKGK